jgi:carboxypeptidase A1
MAKMIAKDYLSKNDLGELLRKFQFTIIPVLNLDGYVYTWEKNRMWRKNRQPNNLFCVGTDPNRNFGYKFGTGGSSKNPCAEDYQGPKAFSTQEARSIATYIKSRQERLISYIDFHAYSQLWMYPFGAECSKYPKEKEKLDRAAKAATTALKVLYGTTFAYGPICEIIYKASGSSVDWAYANAKVVYSMAVELRDKGNHGFLLPPEEIIPSGEETFHGLLAMIKSIAESEDL